MLNNPTKFGDDRTPEEKVADRIAKQEQHDRELAELIVKYPGADDFYNPYLDYKGDMDEALQDS
jgi:hypothetical protein